MRKTFSLAVLVALLLTACSKGSDNPLLSATDGQFIMTFSSGECNAIFFKPSAVRNPRPTDKEDCAQGIQKNAAFAGIPDAVTLQHIEDPKVKERYFSLKK